MKHVFMMSVRTCLIVAGATALCCCNGGNTAPDTLELCKNDDECRYGSYCQDGVCTISSASCDQDTPCPDGQACRNGACVPEKSDGGTDGGDGVDGGMDEDADTAIGPDIEIVTPPLTGSPPVHQLNFGNAAVGVAVQEQVLLTNAGDLDLRIVNLNFEAGSSAHVFSITDELANSLPWVVAPDEQMVIDVVYTADDGNTDHGVLDIVSNDPDEALVKIQLVSEFKGEVRLLASHESLEFGDVPTGQTGQPLSVTLSNQGTGNAVLTVNDIRTRVLSNPDFSVEVRSASGQPIVYPAMVNNGDFLDVTVSYHPQDSGVDSDALVVVSDDPLRPSLEIPIGGRGVIGDLSADPSPVVLGRVQPGFMAEQTVELGNSGGAELAITGMALGDASDEWTLSSTDVNLSALAEHPHQMQPGESLEVLIGFAPVDIGAESGKLLVDHTGPNAQLEVILDATGYIPPIVELDPSPPDLLFGNVQYDSAVLPESSPRTVTIRNVGGEPLEIIDIRRDSGTSLEFTWSPASFAPIPAGGQAPLTVIFTPAETGPKLGALLVTTNDPDIEHDGTSGRFAVAMQARGVDPALVVIPTTPQDFGEVDVGIYADVTVTVVSGSADALTVNNIRLTQGSSQDFRLENLPGFPLILTGAGSQVTFTVRYAPGGIGEDVGAVEILSTDIGNPRVIIDLTGTSTNCQPGWADCDSQVPGCETQIDIDPEHCGNCDTQCINEHGNTECTEGVCRPDCLAPWSDCDNNPANGCESDTATDIDHCLVCNNQCAFDHASAECEATGCVLTGCETDWWDLNDDPADGCEYNCIFQNDSDEPDPQYLDANCDGLDGEVANAVFISTTGSDLSTSCSRSQPCQTIARGLEVAGVRQVFQVLVQRGSYTGVVALSDSHDGIGIHGGYDLGWLRGDHEATHYRTILYGAFHGPDQQYMTIRAHTVQASFSNIELNGPDAIGQPNGRGLSSYVVHARGANLGFVRVTFTQGDGQNGQDGQNGTSASTTPAADGISGGSSDTSNNLCRDEPGGSGGEAGINHTCTGTSGGNGGEGGRMDTCCVCINDNCACVFCDCDATDGFSGTDGSSAGGAWGGGGPQGLICSEGTNGEPGLNGTNGSAGTGGLAGGMLTDGLWWNGKDGSNGAIGPQGRGGGGGGGGGGCDNGDLEPDTSGSGGGGGGAGGCAAPAAGNRGFGGGGSFGVLAIDSIIQVSHCAFQRGAAGHGGSGGGGGAGQPGGEGGPSGGGPGFSGGQGGKGGRGAHSGGAGGGGGGYSFGIFTVSSSVSQEATTFTGGSAGTGGAGGTSPGHSGTSGAAGLLGDVS